jgi:hypothetical protein
MKYKYFGAIPITCYGVEFNPGDEKEVPGVINLNNFLRVTSTQTKKQQEKPSPTTSQKRPVGRPSKSSEPNIVSNDKTSEEQKSEDKNTEKEKM